MEGVGGHGSALPLPRPLPARPRAAIPLPFQSQFGMGFTLHSKQHPSSLWLLPRPALPHPTLPHPATPLAFDMTCVSRPGLLFGACLSNSAEVLGFLLRLVSAKGRAEGLDRGCKNNDKGNEISMNRQTKLPNLFPGSPTSPLPLVP